MTARPASPWLDDRSDLEALADTVPGAEDEVGVDHYANRMAVRLHQAKGMARPFARARPCQKRFAMPNPRPTSRARAGALRPRRGRSGPRYSLGYQSPTRGAQALRLYRCRLRGRSERPAAQSSSHEFPGNPPVVRPQLPAWHQGLRDLRRAAAQVPKRPTAARGSRPAHLRTTCSFRAGLQAPAGFAACRRRSPSQRRSANRKGG